MSKHTFHVGQKIIVSDVNRSLHVAKVTKLEGDVFYFCRDDGLEDWYEQGTDYAFSIDEHAKSNPPHMPRQQFIDAAVLEMVVNPAMNNNDDGIAKSADWFYKQADILADARERFMKGAKKDG